MTENHDERIERLVSLEMDERLDDAGRRELDALLETDDGRRARDGMLAVRAALREDAAAPIEVPPLLRDRIVARVALAREAAPAAGGGGAGPAGGRVLRLVRSIAAAAAVVLGSTGWFASGGLVRADDAHQVRTVEDELHDGTAADGSLRDFLARRFLGAARPEADR